MTCLLTRPSQNAVRLFSSRSKALRPSIPCNARTFVATSSSCQGLHFTVSPVPVHSRGDFIKTSAALVIGDEILNGKSLELNANFFARYCFEHGIKLKRIEVIPDDEAEIIAASRRMSSMYDLVVTSGGCGGTHDDITYASLAKAFSQSLVHHSETQRRMDEMNRRTKSKWGHHGAAERMATQKMATFPEHAEVLFVSSDIWVPVIRLNRKLCVFPGIPFLFQSLLRGLTNYLSLPPPTQRPSRVQVFTERPECMIAPYLTTLQERLRPHIQIGSYPVSASGEGVFVSVIGCDGHTGVRISDIVREVEREIDGKVVSEAEVAKKKQEVRDKFVLEA